MSSESIGQRVSKFKRLRIEQLYEREPDLPIWAYEERFDVARFSLKKIFKVVDKRLKRGRYAGTKL